MTSSEREREIMILVDKMIGYPPTGMLDLLHILAHPEVIDLTRAYLKECDEQSPVSCVPCDR